MPLQLRKEVGQAILEEPPLVRLGVENVVGAALARRLQSRLNLCDHSDPARAGSSRCDAWKCPQPLQKGRPGAAVTGGDGQSMPTERPERGEKKLRLTRVPGTGDG